MAEFIAARIIEAAEISLAKGQAKYKSYFIKTKLYLSFQPAVDSILRSEGHGDVIPLKKN